MRRFLAYLTAPDARIHLEPEEVAVLCRILARVSGRLEGWAPADSDLLWMVVADLRARQGRALRRARW